MNSDRVTVTLPALLRLAQTAKSLKLKPQHIRAGQSGGYLSRFKGRGMEFDEARLYQPGDDVRAIDWRVTARSGKAHTKIFREERERPVFISVDYRATMAFATRGVFKSVQAARLAALLAWAAQQRGDRIGGQIFNDRGCQELKPQNGKQGVLHLCNALVTPDFDSAVSISFDGVLSRLIQHAKPGSQVYIISDFRHLTDKSSMHMTRLSKHCEVVLVHIYDPLECSLPAKGRYRFTDDNQDIEVDSSDRQRMLQYQQRFQRHSQQLKQLSQQLNLSLLQCSTTDEPLSILQ